MKLSKILHRVLPLGALLILSLLAAVPGAQAQGPTATPQSAVPTPEPACLLYYATAPSVNVRSCAGTSCAIVGAVTGGQSLCIRGLTDNANWLLIDLTPEDPASPLYYISSQFVAPGSPGQTIPATCDPYLINVGEGGNAAIRSCASETCAVLGSIPHEGWLCAQQFGGDFNSWVYTLYNDSEVAGWVNTNLIVPGNGASIPIAPLTTAIPTRDPNAPTAPVAPTNVVIPAGQTLAVGSDGSLVNNVPVITPTGQTPIAPVLTQVALAQTTPLAGCMFYRVTALLTTVFSAPAADSQARTTFQQGATLCALGPVAGLESTWLEIDLQPNDTTLVDRAYVQVAEVAPIQPETTPTPLLTAEPVFGTVAPDLPPASATPTATLPVCPTDVPVNPFSLTSVATATQITPSPTATATITLTPTSTDIPSDTPTGTVPPTSTDEPTATATDTTEPAVADTEVPTTAPTRVTSEDGAAAADATTAPRSTRVTTADETLAPSATASLSAPATLAAADFPTQIIHIIRSGDTLTAIALRYGSTVAAIREVNGLDAFSVLRVGQELLVPAPLEVAQALTATPTLTDTATATGTATSTLPASETPINTATSAATATEAVVTVTPSQGPTTDVIPTEAAQQPGLGEVPIICITVTPTPFLTPQPLSARTDFLIAQDLTLSSLQIPNIEMRSPQASYQFVFNTPSDWLLDGTNVLNLTLDYLEDRTASGIEQLSSLLTVYIDDQVIANLTLGPAQEGTQTLSIPIPRDLLTNPRDNTHVGYLVFDAREMCLAAVDARVLVRTDQSFFHFEYHEYFPLIDLAQYPRPFYNSPFPNERESVLVVLPAAPTTMDYEALASLSAGLGRLTFNDLDIRVAEADELSEADRQNNNLILIGEVGTNSLIDALYLADVLPTQFTATGLTINNQSVVPTDGVVQLIPHPENAMHAIMTLTGLTPEAVTKAAKAMAGPPAAFGMSGGLALIVDVRPQEEQATPPERLTLADLGYANVTTNGIGLQEITFRFNLPSGASLAPDAYVDLYYNNARTLDTARASLAMAINGQEFAGDALGGLDTASAPDAAGFKHLVGSIPPQAVRPGEENTLSVRVNALGDWECNPPDDSAVWLTVRQETELFLPRQQVDLAQAPLVGGFPSLFNDQLDLGDVFFVLPSDPTQAELTESVQLISRLGAATAGGLAFSPRIALGQLPSGVDAGVHNFIVIGRPTTTPFLAELNESLPLRFAFDPNTTPLDVLSAIPGSTGIRDVFGIELGVLETFQSPWSSSKVILVISGNSPNGQTDALRVLSRDLYTPAEMNGDIVLASQNAIAVYSSRAEYPEDQATEAATDLFLGEQTAAAASPTLNPEFTVTPGPTFTPSLTRTPSPTWTPSPILTVTPSPTVPTPLPTFVPIPTEELQPQPTEQPAWLPLLLVVTGIIVLLVVVFGILRLLVALRNRNQPPGTRRR